MTKVPFVCCGIFIFPDALLDHVHEVDERVVVRTDLTSDNIAAARPRDPRGKLVLSAQNEVLEVIAPPPEGTEEHARLVAALQATLRAGITSIAIVLLHSYVYPDHERALGQLCSQLGFTHVSLSSRHQFSLPYSGILLIVRVASHQR